MVSTVTNAIIANIDPNSLSEQERNALAILANMPLGDLNAIKQTLKLSDPDTIGPTTLGAFVSVAESAPVNLDLTNAGVSQFKTRNQLGNTGPLAGVIGPQTAGVYYSVIANLLKNSAVRSINASGLDLVKEFEGYEKIVQGTTSVTTYIDPVGVPTIGYGHTGVDVTAGLILTKDQAEALLLSDLTSAERAVSRAVTTAINDNQFSALVSFVFNVGENAFLGSTMLRLLNVGDIAGAAAEFGRWVRGGDVILPGLVTRRDAERKLFLA